MRNLTFKIKQYGKEIQVSEDKRKEKKDSGEEEKINSAQISCYTKPTQTTGQTLDRQKPKRRKNSTLKPGKRRPQTQ